jgi:hypothetical protein
MLTQLTAACSWLSSAQPAAAAVMLQLAACAPAGDFFIWLFGSSFTFTHFSCLSPVGFRGLQVLCLCVFSRSAATGRACCNLLCLQQCSVLCVCAWGAQFQPRYVWQCTQQRAAAVPLRNNCHVVRDGCSLAASGGACCTIPKLGAASHLCAAFLSKQEPAAVHALV